MAEKEKTAAKAASVFGVFQGESGSHTFGGVRFQPLKAVEVPPEVADAAGTARVKFFATAEKAAEEVARLKAEFEKRRKPKK